MILRDYIGTALLNERKKQGRTLRNVAQRAQVALGYVSELERGRKEVSSEVLRSICEALYMTVADLMVDVTVAMKKDEEQTVALERESVELSPINHKNPITL